MTVGREGGRRGRLQGRGRKFVCPRVKQRLPLDREEIDVAHRKMAFYKGRMGPSC